uniref:Uncharacterized protein n=1 Tax=Octopus bimaculoides TaxID=37653 RepID=A0A0L8GK38_OCTBM
MVMVMSDSGLDNSNNNNITTNYSHDHQLTNIQLCPTTLPHNHFTTNNIPLHNH